MGGNEAFRGKSQLPKIFSVVSSAALNSCPVLNRQQTFAFLVDSL